MKREYVDQGTLAAIFEVDRSAILKFQKLGMPYMAGAEGEPNQYDLGFVANWRGGHEVTVKQNIRLTSLEKVLFGLAHGGGYRSFTTWQRQMFALSDWLSASREEIATASGVLFGAELLPFNRS